MAKEKFLKLSDVENLLHDIAINADVLEEAHCAYKLLKKLDSIASYEFDAENCLLRQYISAEMPYRIEEGFGVDVSDEICEECIDSFWEDSDIVEKVNDRMDDHIMKVFDKHGIDY